MTQQKDEARQQFEKWAVERQLQIISPWDAWEAGRLAGLEQAAKMCEAEALRYQGLAEKSQIESLREAYGEKEWVLEKRAAAIREAEGVSKNG